MVVTFTYDNAGKRGLRDRRSSSSAARQIDPQWVLRDQPRSTPTNVDEWIGKGF